eukprot:scaffold652346_cov33-Prasinocladus_malaysianus.AAC.1
MRMLSMDGAEFDDDGATPRETPRHSDGGEREASQFGRPEAGDEREEEEEAAKGEVRELADEEDGKEEEAEGDTKGAPEAGEGPAKYFVAKALNEMARD